VQYEVEPANYKGVCVYTNQLKQPISAIKAVINIEHTDNKNNLEKSLSLPFSVAILLVE